MVTMLWWQETYLQTLEMKAKNLTANFTSHHNYKINLFIYNAAQYVKDFKSWMSYQPFCLLSIVQSTGEQMLSKLTESLDGISLAWKQCLFSIKAYILLVMM